MSVEFEVLKNKEGQELVAIQDREDSKHPYVVVPLSELDNAYKEIVKYKMENGMNFVESIENINP